MNIPDLSFSKIDQFPFPVQNYREWQFFLFLIEAYFRTRSIVNPMVVEIGVFTNRQKRFYEELLEYRHIGIDSWAQSGADIIGNCRDSSVFNKLKDKLKGQPINLLFIDGDHSYEGTKKDFELYSPLTKNIIAIHDVISYRDSVSKFWNELTSDESTASQDRTFITIASWRTNKDKPEIEHGGTGTGIIFKGEKAGRKHLGIKGYTLGSS